VADLLEVIDNSSREALSTTNPDIAAGHIDDLDIALRHLSKSRFLHAAPGGDGAAAPRSLKDFLKTRQSLVDVFRSQGPKAARAWVADPLYQAQGFAIYRMFRRLDCSGQGPTGTPEGGPKAPPRSPGTALGRLAAALGLADALGRAQPIVPNWNIAILASSSALTCIIVIAARARRRRYRRYNCNIPTQLRIGDAAMPARITNISRTGVQLCAESHFTAGDRGNILLDGESVRVKVIWVNQHFLGMTFHRRLKFSPKKLTAAPDLHDLVEILRRKRRN
jgi:hypothetical protein